jgi:hypothetical protein
MDELTLLWTVTSASSFIVSLAVFPAFVALEKLSSKTRRTLLVVLGILAFFPIQSLANLLGIDMRHAIIFFAAYGTLSGIAIVLILFNLMKLLPEKYMKWTFVVTATIVLPPFLFPAGYVAVPVNFGVVFIGSVFSGSIASIPRWFMDLWWFHVLSFSVIGAISYFIGKKYLSSKPVQTTGYAGG